MSGLDYENLISRSLKREKELSVLYGREKNKETKYALGREIGRIRARISYLKKQQAATSKEVR